MKSNEKGYSLVELLVVLSLFGILSSISIATPNKLYDRVVLTSAAMEVKSALQLSQHLSLDESKEYCVEFIGNRFRVREYVVRGRIVLSREFDKNIAVHNGSESRISHNRHGETQYGKFILVNKKGSKIDIDTLIGTGRVRISDIY